MTISNKKLVILREGISEANFCNYGLASYLHKKILPKWTIKPIDLGGGVSIDNIVSVIINEVNFIGSSVTFSTFIDYYATDFLKKYSVSTTEITNIERNVKNDILQRLQDQDIHLTNEQLIVYIQLYEFEALYFANLDIFCNESYPPNTQDRIKLMAIKPHLLEELKSCANNPEMINNGEDTAPSKRIAKYWKKYAVSEIKRITSRYFAQACRSNDFLGIEQIRVKCPHFNAWLETLQRLDQ